MCQYPLDPKKCLKCSSEAFFCNDVKYSEPMLTYVFHWHKFSGYNGHTPVPLPSPPSPQRPHLEGVGLACKLPNHAILLWPSSSGETNSRRRRPRLILPIYAHAIITGLIGAKLAVFCLGPQKYQSWPAGFQFEHVHIRPTLGAYLWVASTRDWMWSTGSSRWLVSGKRTPL